jgi:hypothetical protein
MTTRQKLERFTGCMERFKTDRAVTCSGIGYATVAFVLQRSLLNTDTATITMPVILYTSYATNTAGITMILALILIIQKDTDRTPISS